MHTSLNMLGRTIGSLCALGSLGTAAYLAYLYSTYYRIADNQPISNEGSDLARGCDRTGSEDLTRGCDRTGSEDLTRGCDRTGSEDLTRGCDRDDCIHIGEPYTALTYNVGFGAYTPSFTFFMDTGRMKDGTPTRGRFGKARSRDSVMSCIEGDIDHIRSLGATQVPATLESSGTKQSPDTIQPLNTGRALDFVLLQEVDDDADRSHHVNQRMLFDRALGNAQGRASYFASNLHSAYLAFPPHDCHGRASSGLLSFAATLPREVLRRSYPIDESFPSRFVDLDRCFVVMRFATDAPWAETRAYASTAPQAQTNPQASLNTRTEHGARELVLINSHMSAYDKGGIARAEQLEMLNNLMKAEYAKGNYVVAGGDWNHALFGAETLYPTEQLLPTWIQSLSDSNLPSGFSLVRPDNLEEVPTCRACDIPYTKGITHTTAVDGFIVSDNVRASATNLDLGFAYSDHNPVLLTFTLVNTP